MRTSSSINRKGNNTNIDPSYKGSFGVRDIAACKDKRKLMRTNMVNVRGERKGLKSIEER